VCSHIQQRTNATPCVLVSILGNSFPIWPHLYWRDFEGSMYYYWNTCCLPWLVLDCISQSSNSTCEV